MRIAIAILSVSLSSATLAQEPSTSTGPESGVAAPHHLTAEARNELEAVDPALRELFVPTIAAWLASARDSAVQRGVEEIPPVVRAALTDFVPREVLDRVRWRVDDGMLAVLEGLFGTGYVSAVTLDHVVLFANSDDAHDPSLWVHEIRHVMQYGEWGVEGFAARYLADYEAVEDEAWAFRRQWVEATRQAQSTQGDRGNP